VLRPKKSMPPQLLFLRQYLRKPLSVGAIAPSGPGLARAVAQALDVRPDETVVELGPGTGAFTRQLLKNGIRPEQLVLVEFDRHFVKFLRKQFPGVTVIEGDARRLSKILKELGRWPVNKILSGLPLRSMKPRERVQIAHAIAGSLTTGGILVQFSYFKIAPLPRASAARAGLHASLAGLVLGNIPPAFVWRYAKAEPELLAA
jgi:phosphatidylethanolamine/phosphatidyl-N-methylethanolamine N-methyltransferase